MPLKTYAGEDSPQNAARIQGETYCRLHHQSAKNQSESPISPRPVDAPAPAGYSDPHKLLGWRSAGMMVESRGALIEAARMPRVTIAESLVVEVMAELVTQSA